MSSSSEHYFILDTSVLRGEHRHLPPPRPGVTTVIPVMAIQELLSQALRPNERAAACAGLSVLGRDGSVAVSQEPRDRLRECFGLPPSYPEAVPVYLHLAELVLAGASPDRIERRWRAAEQAAQVAVGPDWVDAAKDGSWGTEMARQAARVREIYVAATAEVRLQSEANPPPPERALQMRDAAIRRYFHDNGAGQSVSRMWILNQVAAAAGLPGIQRGVEGCYTGVPMEDVYESVSSQYRGGLELFLSLHVRYFREVSELALEPNRNDLVDLLVAASVEDGDEHALVTEDARWLRLARESGLGHRVLRVRDLVSGEAVTGTP